MGLRLPLRVYLVIILGISLGLRALFIPWGLPHAGGPFHLALHGDEKRSMVRVFEYRPLRLDQTFTDYTHPIMLDLQMFYLKEIIRGLGLMQWPNTFEEVDSYPAGLRAYTITGRSLNVAFAVLSVFLVFSIGRRLYGDSAGLVAATIIAITPVHILETAIIKYNSFGVLITLVGISLGITISRSNRVAPYFWAGVTLAVALSTTHIQGFIILWFMWVGHWSKYRHAPFGMRIKKLFSRKVFLVYGIGVLSYLAINHWIVFNPRHWWADFGNCFDVNQHDEVYNNDYICSGLPGLRFLLLAVQPYAFGIPVSILLPFAVGYGIRRRTLGDWLIIPVIALTYYSAFKLDLKYTRTLVHPSTLIALVVGRLCWQFYKIARKKGVLKLATLTLVVAGVGVTLAQIAGFVMLFYQRNSRLEASDWLAEHVPKQTRVMTLYEFWEFHPPILGEGYFTPGETYYSIDLMYDRDYDQLVQSDSEYLVTSDLELYGLYGKYVEYPDRYPRQSEFIRRLLSNQHFELIYDQDDHLAWFPTVFNNPLMPLDLGMINPRILIFRRLVPPGSVPTPS